MFTLTLTVYLPQTSFKSIHCEFVKALSGIFILEILSYNGKVHFKLIFNTETRLKTFGQQKFRQFVVNGLKKGKSTSVVLCVVRPFSSNIWRENICSSQWNGVKTIKWEQGCFCRLKVLLKTFGWQFYANYAIYSDKWKSSNSRCKHREIVWFQFPAKFDQSIIWATVVICNNLLCWKGKNK